jgi:hypothetical protein
MIQGQEIDRDQGQGGGAANPEDPAAKGTATTGYGTRCGSEVLGFPMDMISYLPYPY